MKPENVLYVSGDDDAEVKLTDFGLAMLDEGPSVMRRDDNLVGTPGSVWVLLALSYTSLRSPFFSFPYKKGRRGSVYTLFPAIIALKTACRREKRRAQY